jgi:hypothetical protein
MINITYIYLIEGIDNSPYKVYIGKTKNPQTRKYLHRHKYGNIKYSIIDQIESNNHDDWKPLESYWIYQFRAWGFNVINKNNGGGGPVFRTEEQKQKISNSKLGHIVSKETKLKMSISNSKPKPLGFGDKLRKPNTILTSYYKPLLQYDLEGNFIKEWNSGKEVSKMLKINRASLSSALTGKNKTAGGFVWHYKNHKFI